MKREVQETTENETLHEDEAAVCRLLADLEPVEAPANFERRVMAKIADGQQQSRRMFGLPLAVAYSLPLLLVLVVVAGYFINSGTSSQTPPINNDAGMFSQIKSSDERPAINENVSRPDSTTVVFGNTAVQKNSIAESRPTTVNIPRQKETGGSRHGSDGPPDQTLLQVKPIFPAGISNQNSSANPEEVMSPSSLPVHEVLSEIGIKAEYKGGWVVRSVISNSMASRSDIRIGDVIVSLDNTVLSANTVFKGRFGASSVRVRRNGQELELSLK